MYSQSFFVEFGATHELHLAGIDSLSRLILADGEAWKCAKFLLTWICFLKVLKVL